MSVFATARRTCKIFNVGHIESLMLPEVIPSVLLWYLKPEACPKRLLGTSCTVLYTTLNMRDYCTEFYPLETRNRWHEMHDRAVLISRPVDSLGVARLNPRVCRYLGTA